MFLDQQIVEYLVAKRKLTGKQAGQLLAAAEGQSLELIMVERGMLDKHSLLQIKSLLTELRAVDLTAVPIDLQVVKLLPASMSRKFAAVVYGLEEERLLVASANPTDPFARYYISMRTNREIEILVAYIGDVQVLQDRAYPPEEPEVLGPSTFVVQPPLGKRGPGIIAEANAASGSKRVRLSQEGGDAAYSVPEPTHPRSHSLVKPAAARPGAAPPAAATVSPQPAEIVAIAETEIHEVRPITLTRPKSATLPAPPAVEGEEAAPKRDGRKSGDLDGRPKRSSGSLDGRSKKDSGSLKGRPKGDSGSLGKGRGRASGGLDGVADPAPSLDGASESVRAVRKSGSLEMPSRAERVSGALDPPSPGVEAQPVAEEPRTGRKSGVLEMPSRQDRPSGRLEPTSPAAAVAEPHRPVRRSLELPSVTARASDTVVAAPLAAPATTHLAELVSAVPAEPAPVDAGLAAVGAQDAEELEIEVESAPEVPPAMQAPATTRELAPEPESAPEAEVPSHEPNSTVQPEPPAMPADEDDGEVGTVRFNLNALPPITEETDEPPAPPAVWDDSSTVVHSPSDAPRVVPPAVVSRTSERLEATLGTGVNLLDSLAVMSTNLSESGRLGYVVPQILHTARVLTSADATAFLTCEADRRYISYNATDGGSATASRYAVPFDQSTVAGWCVVKSEIVSITSLRADSRFSTTAEQAASMPCGATAVVPVRWGSEMLGALVAARHSDGTELDTRPLLMLAAPLAAAVWARRQESSIHDIRMETVQALLDWHEVASPGARQHGADVAQLATSMARAMALPPADIEELCLASLLHDIGLLPGREEQAHPQRSSQILQKIGILQRLIPLVKYHHERFDGLGYPQGLKGDAIPLAARILAIAEVYCESGLHKMERDDPSINEFLKRFGSEFDPSLLSAFIRSVNLD